MNEMSGMTGTGWMNAVMWLSLLFGLGLLVLLLIGIIAGIRCLTKSPSPSRGGQESDRAVEILRERYAKGEIGRDEFEQMRRDLS